MVFFTLHSFSFCGVEFKLEPFDCFSFKMLLGEMLCNFSQIFPPKNLEKVRMRQFFFEKLKIISVQ